WGDSASECLRCPGIRGQPQQESAGWERLRGGGVSVCEPSIKTHRQECLCHLRRRSTRSVRECWLARRRFSDVRARHAVPLLRKIQKRTAAPKKKAPHRW